jgi:hypothetical protein
MKDAIVGGILAGLISGSIVAGAIVVTRQDVGVPAQSAAVAIDDRQPIRVNVVSTPPPAFTNNAPDGSSERPFSVTLSGPDGTTKHPFSVTQSGSSSVSQPGTIRISGPVYTWSCDTTSVVGPPIGCR